MNAPHDQPWTPDPQLLAAYFDGEFEGRPDLADLRVRLEAWLEQHADATFEAKQDRRLRELMLDTAAPEPGAAAWAQTLSRIEDARQRPLPRQEPARSWRLAIACAAGVVLVFGLIFGVGRSWMRSHPPEDFAVQPKPVPKEETEVFPVAAAHEVVVLRIEGEDTPSLVVGLLPLIGPLELAAPGDVRVLNVRPDERDRMVPRVRHDGPGRPMIWVQMEAEE